MIMPNHVKVYFQYHDYAVMEEILCEVCGKPAVDIHHKVERSVCKKHGIEQDCIENLIALDRDCHEDDELKAKLKEETLELLKGEQNGF